MRQATSFCEFIVNGCKIINSSEEGEHVPGVALVLSRLAQKCKLGHRPVNDQILSARFQTMTHPITIIQVYVPKVEAEEDSINSFYTDLQSKVSRAHRNDILIIMGDFIARVGSGEIMNY